MACQRRSKIPEADWEAHKTRIEKLFLREKKTLDGLDGVKECMRRQHGFDASIAQYESRLRLWNFRKKMNGTDWITIGRMISEREEQGLRSEVWAYGECLRPSKVRKEVSRYRGAAIDDRQDRIGPDELPVGVEVRSPTVLVEVPEATSALLGGATNASEIENHLDAPSTAAHSPGLQQHFLTSLGQTSRYHAVTGRGTSLYNQIATNLESVDYSNPTPANVIQGSPTNLECGSYSIHVAPIRSELHMESLF